MAQLREFVYIDNNSLNSNLSSLGKGIPSEITHATEDQTEKSGGAGGRIAGIGAEGDYANLDREQIETTLDITAPYRFQDLIDKLDDRGMPIKENPDPRGLSRGDVVKIKGNVYPMSLLKVEMAISAFSEFAGDDIREAFRSIGQQIPISKNDEEEMDALATIMERFTGDRYPLRIETSDSTYCTALKRNHMRKSVFESFIENERFTLFGRVNKHILGNETWNPFLAIDVIEKYVSEEDAPDDFQSDFRTAADHLNISIEDDDFEVRGHTALIEPIAMYW